MASVQVCTSRYGPFQFATAGDGSALPLLPCTMDGRQGGPPAGLGDWSRSKDWTGAGRTWTGAPSSACRPIIPRSNQTVPAPEALPHCPPVHPNVPSPVGRFRRAQILIFSLLSALLLPSSSFPSSLPPPNAPDVVNKDPIDLPSSLARLPPTSIPTSSSRVVHPPPHTVGLPSLSLPTGTVLRSCLGHKATPRIIPALIVAWPANAPPSQLAQIPSL